MTTWVVVVPVIAPREVTAVARRGWDVDAPNLLVVDNTPDGAYVEGPWQYHAEEGRNLGVAASWNKGLDLDCDVTFFMSSYLQLDDGLAKTVERMLDVVNDFGVITWQACHLWGFTRRTVQLCGRFDEHYYPAYFEDTDYIRRLELTGCHTAANPMPKIAIPGVCPQAHTIKTGLAQVDFAKLRERYLRKWNGDPFRERYTHPFNDPSLTIRDWGPP